MGYLFYSVCILWWMAIAVLVVAKWRFWPPVYQLGIPVMRTQHAPLRMTPSAGSAFVTRHGAARVTRAGTVLFLGAKATFRSPAGLIASIEVGDRSTDVIARIPADVIVGAAFWIGLTFSMSAAILAGDGSVLVAAVALLLGSGLVFVWWTIYVLAYLDSRKADVVGFVDYLEMNMQPSQA